VCLLRLAPWGPGSAGGRGAEPDGGGRSSDTGRPEDAG
jgi:hypothetical protein